MLGRDNVVEQSEVIAGLFAVGEGSESGEINKVSGGFEIAPGCKVKCLGA